MVVGEENVATAVRIRKEVADRGDSVEGTREDRRRETGERWRRDIQRTQRCSFGIERSGAEVGRLAGLEAGVYEK